MSTTEHNIQNEIRAWCGEHGYPCFRCNVGKVKCADGTWFDTGLPPGFPDLLILANRTVYFCEVKTRYGQQREEQRRFQEAMEGYGYTYILARSVIDVERVLTYNNHHEND